MTRPLSLREVGTPLTFTTSDRVWADACDEAMLSRPRLDCHAATFAEDGPDPLRAARMLAWQLIGHLKSELPEEFETAAVDVWIGQRCVEGAFVPQLVLAFGGLSSAVLTWFRAHLASLDALVDGATALNPVEAGLFPVARVEGGRLIPRSLPVDFLLACSRRFRAAHGLPPWTRDPYSQLATGAVFPQEFAWLTQDGTVIDAEGGAIEIIDNSRLVPADVPGPDALDDDCLKFAATFDGYEEYGEYDAAVETADEVRVRAVEGAKLSEDFTLRELRTAMFVEYLKQPSARDATYCDAVLTAIRTCVERSSERTRRLRRSSEGARGAVEVASGASSSFLSVAPVISFEEMEREEQCALAHQALLQCGPAEKEQAVRAFAAFLREEGLVTYQRLHQDGPLYALLEEIVERCVKDGSVDRPKRGWVRALLPDAAAYSREQWRECLLAVVTEDPVDRDEAVRLAAAWAKDRQGLQYERIREGGAVDRGLRSAMNSAVRRGEITRVGSHSIRRSNGANDEDAEDPSPTRVKVKKGRKRADEAPSEMLLDLGTLWLAEGRGEDRIEIDNIDLHMLACAGPGDYSSSRIIHADRQYMLTLEFTEGSFRELLFLLPADDAEAIRKALSGKVDAPTILEIPPGVLVVSVDGRLAAKRTARGESYVPVAVSKVRASNQGLLAIAFRALTDGTEGTLDLMAGPEGPAHAVHGELLREGDALEAWFAALNEWVPGYYEATTNGDGGFEERFAVLRTEGGGMRPLFVGVKVRRPASAGGTNE